MIYNRRCNVDILYGTEMIKLFICVLSATLHELEPLVSDTDDRKTHEKYDNNLIAYVSLSILICMILMSFNHTEMPNPAQALAAVQPAHSS